MQTLRSQTTNYPRTVQTMRHSQAITMEKSLALSQVESLLTMQRTYGLTISVRPENSQSSSLLTLRLLLDSPPSWQTTLTARRFISHHHSTWPRSWLVSRLRALLWLSLTKSCMNLRHPQLKRLSFLKWPKASAKSSLLPLEDQARALCSQPLMLQASTLTLLCELAYISTPIFKHIQSQY